MLLTMRLMAASMLAIALAPGYATLGHLCPVLLAIGRLATGFALGEIGPSGT